MKYAIILLMLLSGCATKPEVTIVPTPVSCVKPEKVPVKPEYSILVLPQEILDKEDGTFVIELARSFALAKTYSEDLEIIVNECKKIPVLESTKVDK